MPLCLLLCPFSQLEPQTLSHEASKQVKEHGKDNNLIELIEQDEYFKPIWPDLRGFLDPKNFTGRAAQQVEKFLRDDVNPFLNEVNQEIEALGGQLIENAPNVDLNV